jgi:hypothetical protein
MVGRARFRGAGGQNSWVGGLLVASSSLIASRIVALCEEEDAAAADEDDDDPYANLPEEDEETSCTLCKTFRQGPCGPPWRKLERCFKDHADNGDKGGGATRCTRYFTAHHECVSNYTNLYHLISLDQKQELIANTEKAVNDNERVCWPKAVSDDFFDWSQWRSYCKDVGMTSSSYLLHTKAPPRPPAPPAPVPSNEVMNDATSPPLVLPPLWKRGPENTEPLLIATEVKVPTTEQNGMLLKFAYVVDQDGFALGVTFHDYHRKQSEQQQERAAAVAAEQKANNVTENTGEETDAAAADVDNVARTEEDDDPPVTLRSDVTLEFYILPGDTRTVQLYALYTEDPSQVDESKKIMDAFLYKTVEYQLADQC